MSTRPYLTELTLEFTSNRSLLLHPKHLKQLDEFNDERREVADNAHIYLILTHPKLRFVPGSLVVDDARTVGQFSYVVEGVPRTSGFTLDGKSVADRVEIGPYPHNMLLMHKDGMGTASVSTARLLEVCSTLDDESLKTRKVAYVGMAYGTDGARSAGDRLLNHSTLQQILAELNHDQPDQEVSVLLMEFNPPRAQIKINGNDKSLRIEDDRDVVDDLQRTEQQLTEELQIMVIKAALIRYFAPRFNTIYKHSFPHEHLKCLEVLYKIDFSALAVGLDTAGHQVRLYSDEQAPGSFHAVCYDLHNPQERRSFFDLSVNEPTLTASEMSGPMY